MEHCQRFDLIKGYYDSGLWTKQRVRKAVGKWITEAEYEEITGEFYAS